MIDFSECTIHSLCSPSRMHMDELSQRLNVEFRHVVDLDAQSADNFIQRSEYDRAAELIGEMIERLEELKEDVESDHDIVHRLTYDEVDHRVYFGRVVRAAEEYGEDACTLGALKAAKKDLESSAV